MSGAKVIISDESDDAVAVVRIVGRVDEHTDFTPVKGLKAPVLVLELSGLTVFTSLGLKLWATMMREVPQQTTVRLTACSVSVVHQLNQMPGFGGGRQFDVESIHIPYYCDFCDRSDIVRVECSLLRGADGNVQLPARPCGICGRMQDAEVPPARYLMFLSRRRGHGESHG